MATIKYAYSSTKCKTEQAAGKGCQQCHKASKLEEAKVGYSMNETRFGLIGQYLAAVQHTRVKFIMAEQPIRSWSHGSGTQVMIMHSVATTTVLRTREPATVMDTRTLNCKESCMMGLRRPSCSSVLATVVVCVLDIAVGARFHSIVSSSTGYTLNSTTADTMNEGTKYQISTKYEGLQGQSSM